MRKVFYGLILVLSLLVLWRFGMLVGGLMLLVVFFVVRVVMERVEYAREIDRYKTMYEDVFVVSRNPYTDEQFKLWGDEFDELVVWADFEDVMQEVRDQEEWLRDAENEFFLDSSLNDDQRLRVIPIIYQDGEYVNERWGKPFKKRVRKEIEERRAKRHALLKKTDPAWYHKVSNRQRGVAWAK